MPPTIGIRATMTKAPPIGVYIQATTMLGTRQRSPATIQSMPATFGFHVFSILIPPLCLLRNDMVRTSHRQYFFSHSTTNLLYLPTIGMSDIFHGYDFRYACFNRVHWHTCYPVNTIRLLWRSFQ